MAKNNKNTKRNLTLRTGKTVRTCNAYPMVWAAIHGCEGKTNRWHYVTGSFGRRESEYVCPSCHAAKEAAMNTKDLQKHLSDAQGAAGIENYRIARVKWLRGRPVLIK